MRIYVTSGWFNATAVSKSGWGGNNADAITENGVYVTHASSATTNYADYLTYYGFRFTDPRSGLPSGYSNFTVTSFDAQLKGHQGLGVLAVGEAVSPLRLNWIYNGDSHFWDIPRLLQIYDVGASPTSTNSYSPIFNFATINPGSAGSDGLTFDPSKVFADASPTYAQGPQFIPFVAAAGGTPVGTWNIDNVRARFNYYYDIPDPPGGSTARKLIEMMGNPDGLN